ncbi:MAG: UbiA prenyltransferase family protein, partial [Holophagales bacterium]|nr:UbiA prenyltransferase family protein [Holophagales bacterium]
MPSSYDSALLEAEDLLGTEGGADARLPIPLLPAPAPARPGRSPLLGALRRPLRTLDRFVRLHFLGFSTMLVLLGVASVAAEPGWIQLAGILAVAFCFHNFAYVLNHVIDLPVDRSHPARQDDYLVRGTIRPWQALAFALLQIPLAAGIHAFLVAGASSAGKPPLLVLLAGFGLMAVYDLWGKSCPVPPLTDLAQGLGWASLALYGAMAMGGPPNVLTWTAVAMGTGFILLINGVHGGLRDLSNDLDRGRRTTAIFFGSRPLPPEGAPSVNPGLVAFSMA